MGASHTLAGGARSPSDRQRNGPRSTPWQALDGSQIHKPTQHHPRVATSERPRLDEGFTSDRPRIGPTSTPDRPQGDLRPTLRIDPETTPDRPPPTRRQIDLRHLPASTIDHRPRTDLKTTQGQHHTVTRQRCQPRGRRAPSLGPQLGRGFPSPRLGHRCRIRAPRGALCTDSRRSWHAVRGEMAQSTCARLLKYLSGRRPARILGMPAKCRAISARDRPKLAASGPQLVELRPTPVEFGRLRDQNGDNTGGLRPQKWPNLATPSLCRLGSSLRRLKAARVSQRRRQISGTP